MTRKNCFKVYKNKSKLMLLTAFVLSLGCAPGKFERRLDDASLSPNERENLYSEILSKNLLSSNSMNSKSSGDVSVASSVAPNAIAGGGGAGAPMTPPIPPPVPCQMLNFTVYLDKNNDGKFSPEEKLGLLKTYSGPKGAKDNYNYFSASGHPRVGPTPEPFKTKIFFYTDYRGANLNVLSNIDSDSKSAGSDHNLVSIDITTNGNSGADGVVLSDDHLELKEQVTVIPLTDTHSRPEIYPIDLTKSYKARWQYWYNTDGGIIGPFNNTNSQIKINLLKLGDIKTVELVSATGEVLSIPNLGTPNNILLKAEATPTPAHPEDDSVVTGCPQPGDAKLQVKIKPVTSINLISYPSTCSSQTPDIVCPAMERANDYLIRGITQTSGAVTMNTQVRFMELFMACAEVAKKAKATGKALIIKGRGTQEPSIAEMKSLYFSEISNCELEK